MMNTMVSAIWSHLAYWSYVTNFSFARRTVDLSYQDTIHIERANLAPITVINVAISGDYRQMHSCGNVKSSNQFKLLAPLHSNLEYVD